MKYNHRMWTGMHMHTNCTRVSGYNCTRYNCMHTAGLPLDAGGCAQLYSSTGMRIHIRVHTLICKTVMFMYN